MSFKAWAWGCVLSALYLVLGALYLVLGPLVLPRSGYVSKPRVAALGNPGNRVGMNINRNAVASIGFAVESKRGRNPFRVGI